jgi:hypothetical protein
MALKVFELMAQLAKCEAGADVFVSRAVHSHTTLLDFVENEAADGVYLRGDGSKPEPGEDEIEL